MFCPPPLEVKESGTLPRGPREVSEVWRANARFGYTVMSLYMWDSSDPIGTVHTWLSRVIEKSAIFVVQILNDLERLNKKYGIVTACVGGGQGIAGIIERM